MPVSNRPVASKQGGYCTTTNLMKIEIPVATGLCHEGDEMTVKMLEDLHIHRAEVHLVRAAARSIQFLDKNNCVTEKLVRYVQTSGDEHRAILVEGLHYGYPDIFERFKDTNLAQVSHKEWRQAFIDGNYQPSAKSLQPKVIALFKGLSRIAGLLPGDESISHEENISHLANGHVHDIQHSELPATVVTPKSHEGKPMQEIPQARATSIVRLPPKYPAIAGQVAALQSFLQMPTSSEWSEDLNEWWQDNIRINVKSLLKLIGDKEAE